MKHLSMISRAPRQAQAPSLTAFFSLVANVLEVVSLAVLTKENGEFPDINLPTPDNDS